MYFFYYRLWEKGEANINSLRLLVNLSCCPDMVPHILAAKVISSTSLNEKTSPNLIDRILQQ